MYKYLLLLYYIKVQGEASQVGKSPPSVGMRQVSAVALGSREHVIETKRFPTMKARSIFARRHT